MSLSEQQVFSAEKNDQPDPGKQPSYFGLMSFEVQSHYAARLNDLIAEHDDLDQAVASLLSAAGYDNLVINRLKKRKLQLKDEISEARFRLQGFAERVA